MKLQGNFIKYMKFIRKPLDNQKVREKIGQFIFDLLEFQKKYSVKEWADLLDMSRTNLYVENYKRVKKKAQIDEDRAKSGQSK